MQEPPSDSLINLCWYIPQSWEVGRKEHNWIIRLFLQQTQTSESQSTMESANLDNSPDSAIAEACDLGQTT